MSQVLSAHARYRELLEALASRPERNGWVRMYERFAPDREPFATLVFATRPQELVRVDAFDDGRRRLTRIPPDPGLPALASALEEPDRSVVRYHPGRRCTLRVAAESGTTFVKLFANEHGRSVHTRGVQLWRAAQRGELAFHVARPKRFDEHLGAVWQDAVGGEPVKERLESADGELLAHAIGRAAGTLPRARLRPGARRDRRAELAQTAVRSAELVRRVPDLGDAARALLGALESAQAACPEREQRPIHGALHASQWLENGSGLALLDYDSLALGDPELDAATFMAGLDAQNRERVAVEELNEAFVAGYEETAGPLDRRLLAVYRAERGVEKALRVARRVRPDGDRKAARRLQRALHALGAAR